MKGFKRYEINKIKGKNNKFRVWLASRIRNVKFET